MPGKYQNPETIKTIVEKIDKREWILPGIQRRFVWDTERIINLFDSLMQGYPIGTLMIWKVSSKDTINKITFYNFLQKYQERFREACDDYKPSSDVVYAVIDGQQRLNSIYIGLTGSYAEKLPRKKWKSAYDSSIQPEKFLYLNLCEYENDEENGRYYKFEFMSSEEYRSLENKNHWYKISKILDLKYFDSTQLEDDEFDNELNEIINSLNIEEQLIKEAKRTLKKLYKLIFIDETINYYLEQNDSLDRVVDIFVRTNNGGVPLTFSDLVMAVISSEWMEARSKIDELVMLVRADTGIEISRDFVLKAFLYIYSEDIKFRIGNFNNELIQKLEHELETIGEYIKSVCIFAKQIGLNNETIRAKYALLPLLYYSYKTKNKLDNLGKNKKSRRNAGIWLKLALIKTIFGGSPDAVLIPIRKVIDNNRGDFPGKQIVDEFVGRPRNFTLTEEEIERRVLETNYGTNEARLLLSIVTEINPEYTYEHVDHCYPKSMFRVEELDELEFLDADPELRQFYQDKQNWNTLGNLQLLNQAQNESKLQKRLSVWLQNNSEYKSTLILPKDEKGNEIIEDERFKEFVTGRRKKICELIQKKITFNDEENM